MVKLLKIIYLNHIDDPIYIISITFEKTQGIIETNSRHFETLQVSGK